MNCTNCGNEVSDSAKVCGHCGHRLKAVPVQVPAQYSPPRPLASTSETPGWVWGLAGSMVALAGILAVFVVFMILRSKIPASTAPIINPPQVVSSQPTEIINTPVVAYSSPIPTSTGRPPTQIPIVTSLRCNLYQGMNISIIWIDIPKGSTVAQLYAKMPGGVPGLGKVIPGDNKSWEYEFKIGDYRTTSCKVIKGYEERLYCDYPMPSGYAASIRPMELYVNGCNRPIYKDERAELPAIREAGGSGNGGGLSCSADLDASACAAAGGTYTILPGFCDPGPCPSTCVCP